MKTFLAILFAFSTAKPVFACAKTTVSDSSYILDKTVISSFSESIYCYCDDGDVIISGGCAAGGAFELWSTNPVFTQGNHGWKCGLYNTNGDRSSRGKVRAYCRSD